MGALAITGAGLTFFAVGQITSGAKVFAAVTGSNSYYLGILLTIVITVIYTVSGGIKSMAKVASIQGVIMLIATFSIIGVLIADNVEKYGGSVQAAMEYLGTVFPGAIQATQASPSGTLWALRCLPAWAWALYPTPCRSR